MHKILERLSADYPCLSFKKSDSFYWSPTDSMVYYSDLQQDDDNWTLLHETSHGILGHTNFSSDFELLRIEVEAWELAKKLAAGYSLTIDVDHIEDCLDTYRTWIYRRSLCPNCELESLQKDEKTYGCFNCGKTWHVSSSRLCRPYRASIRPMANADKAKTTA